MKRREAFKKIGILALLSGGGLSLLSSCVNKNTEATTTIETTTPLGGQLLRQKVKEIN